MTRKLGYLLAAGALLLLGGLLFVVQHYAGRPDRIAAAAAEVELKKVGDEVLHYELEVGQLPKTLQDLVPKYIRQDQIGEGQQGRYRYDPQRRYMEELNGPLVRGLFSYRIAPRRYDFPPPEKSLTVSGLGLVRQQPAPKPDTVLNSTPSTPTLDPIPVKTSDLITPPAPDTTPELRPDALQTLVNPKPVMIAARGTLTDELLLPSGPKLEQAPAGALVFEAEHFTETNYGWEVHPDKDCAGGAYLHAKEGIANGPGQTKYQVGDFYNLKATRDVTRLRYHLHIPKAGRYYVYGRMWTTDSHCSNFVCLEVDQGGPYMGGMGNRTPFRWAWSPIKDNPRYFSAGDHFLHGFIHEDGVKIDQFILSPQELSGNTPYVANLMPGEDTGWQKDVEHTVHLSFDYKSQVLSPDVPPQYQLVLRRLKKSTGQAHLKVTLERAAPEGKELVLVEGELDLGKLESLSFLPLSFKQLDVAKLPRREFALTASLTLHDEGKTQTLGAVRIPLLRPLVWEIFGPGKHLESSRSYILDGDGEPKPGDNRKWTAFAETSFDHFGVLDFGLHTSGSSTNPPQWQTLYARTWIKVHQPGTFLFKVQNDDQMHLWLDGKEIYRNDEQLPVTRNPGWLKLKLEAGEHRLRMRVNQMEGRWQAGVRIRSEQDDLCDVEGIAPAGDAK